MDEHEAGWVMSDVGLSAVNHSGWGIWDLGMEEHAARLSQHINLNSQMIRNGNVSQTCSALKAHHIIVLYYLANFKIMLLLCVFCN